MNKPFLTAISLAVATFAHASDDKAYLAILAETKVMKIPGMPAMPKMPAGFKIPGMHSMPAMPGEPARTLNIRLWSPSIAPDDAFASIAPPAGLKQGDKLNLEIYRPKPETVEMVGTTPGFDPDSNPDFTIKIYWGSSETVKDGQPKIIRWTGLTQEQKDAMKKRAQESRQSATSYFYKPNWTTGYWPTGSEPGQIDKEASLVGNFALTTNYTGNVTIEAPKNVDFLAPYELSSPSLEEKIDLKGSIPFQWSEISNVLGQHATIMGMEGKNTLIIWTSSEVYAERLMGDMGFLQMAEVKDFVNQKVFMPGNQASATVPAGIFKDCDFAMFTMTGYGTGTALENVQPVPRIQTKTVMNIMLGGKRGSRGF